MTNATALTRSGIRWNIALLQLVFVYLLGLKLWFDLSVSPMGDEAYYWMWGQHLSWSYFDHPPLDGWLQGLVAAVFGWSNLSVRLLTWFSLAGSLAILWLWSGRLSPDDRAGWFWHSAVIYLTIPVIAVMTTFAFHDHLLLFFVLASAYVFDGFAAGWEAGRPTWRQLFLSAALLGLAVLTKYNGIFLGLGFAGWIVARPKLRRLLLTPQLWLAVLLAVAMQAPVFYWNLVEGWASLRFHLIDRPTVDWRAPNFAHLPDYLATMVLVLSPVLFIALFRIPFLKRRSPDEDRVAGLSTAIFLASSIAWAAISIYIYVFFHWNIVAYVGLAPLAYRLLGPRVAWLHIAYGLVLTSVALLTYTVAPMTILGYGDRGARAAYGWPAVAAQVAAELKAHPGAFAGSTHYTYASQLGFELHDTDVAAFSTLPSQYGYWWDAAAHDGRDAIVVADRLYPIDGARPYFGAVEKLEDVSVNDNLGHHVWTFELWLARGYHHD